MNGISKFNIFVGESIGLTSAVIPNIERTLNRIEEIKVSKPKIFGLVFIYPENSNFDKGKYVEFSHAFKEVKIDIKNFKKKVTDYLDVMYKLEPPEPNLDCCGIMHNFFYDKKKLK